MRNEHVGSKYEFVCYSYFNEFAVQQTEHAAVVLLDDRSMFQLENPIMQSQQTCVS